MTTVTAEALFKGYRVGALPPATTRWRLKQLLGGCSRGELETFAAAHRALEVQVHSLLAQWRRLPELIEKKELEAGDWAFRALFGDPEAAKCRAKLKKQARLLKASQPEIAAKLRSAREELLALEDRMLVRGALANDRTEQCFALLLIKQVVR